jgi:hypothetical protein
MRSDTSGSILDCHLTLVINTPPQGEEHIYMYVAIDAEVYDVSSRSICNLLSSLRACPYYTWARRIHI